MDTLIIGGIGLLLVFVAFFTGSYIEKRHYASIRKREKDYIDLPVVSFDDADGDFPTNESYTRAQLVSGSVVISVDRFKQLLAALRNLFGGRITAYESLLDRARREASLRMKKSAEGAAIIVNLRLETASISGKRAQSMGTIEVHAYATALYQDEAHAAVT